MRTVQIGECLGKCGEARLNPNFRNVGRAGSTQMWKELRDGDIGAVLDRWKKIELSGLNTNFWEKLGWAGSTRIFGKKFGLTRIIISPIWSVCGARVLLLRLHVNEPFYITYERVTSHSNGHVWMGHVLSHMNESCHICMSHMNQSCHFTHECIMSCHIWISHVTYESVMSCHIHINHVISHMNASCHVTYTRVMSHTRELSCHIWMRHAMSHIKESCHWYLNTPHLRP